MCQPLFLKYGLTIKLGTQGPKPLFIYTAANTVATVCMWYDLNEIGQAAQNYMDKNCNCPSKKGSNRNYALDKCSVLCDI